MINTIIISTLIIIIIIIIIDMAEVLVGTSYNQIYNIPLDTKTPISIMGDKKKVPVTCICIPSQPLSGQLLQVIYSNHQQTYIQNIDKQSQNQSQQECSVSMAAVQLQQNQKIIWYQYQHYKGFYCTNQGNVYAKDFVIGAQSQASNNLYTKRYHNDMYIDKVRSLPPQRAGTLPPQYRRVAVEIDQHGITVAFIGRGVLPFVYEGIFAQNIGTVIWKAKNVSNDELDLEVPINDVDGCFINKVSHLVVANTDNRIRVYDVKSKRRKPIIDVTLNQIIKVEKTKLNKIVKSQCEKYLYVGNERGSIYELDMAKKFAVVGKIKGVTTTITDMKYRDGQLYVISLDGYLRIFNAGSKQKQFERYLNTHPLVLKLKQPLCNIQQKQEQAYNITELNLDHPEEQNEQKKEKGAQKVKKIRKRNKVGLKYIENAHFDEVKLEDMENQQRMKQEAKEQVNDSDLDL